MSTGACQPDVAGGTHAGWVIVCPACHHKVHDVSGVYPCVMTRPSPHGPPPACLSVCLLHAVTHIVFKHTNTRNLQIYVSFMQLLSLCFSLSLFWGSFCMSVHVDINMASRTRDGTQKWYYCTVTGWNPHVMGINMDRWLLMTWSQSGLCVGVALRLHPSIVRWVSCWPTQSLR